MASAGRTLLAGLFLVAAATVLTLMAFTDQMKVVSQSAFILISTKRKSNYFSTGYVLGGFKAIVVKSNIENVGLEQNLCYYVFKHVLS